MGQSESPGGTTAMAVITLLYGVLVSMSILCAVGGAVLYQEAYIGGYV